MHHEAVALALDLESLIGGDLFSDNGIVDSQHTLSPYIAQPLSHGRGVHDIREKDGDGAVRCGMKLEVGPLDLDR